MSATLFGCGCLVSHDGEMQIAQLTPCERHRSELQPELEALYQRVIGIRAREAARREAPATPPDVECVTIPESPLELIRRRP